MISVNKIFIIYSWQKSQNVIYCFNDNNERLVINMKAVVTVIGKDAVGILAKVSTKCAEYNANVIEVTQSVMQEMFAMIMMVDISKLNSDFAAMAESLEKLGEENGLKVTVMHENIFNCMHHI